MRIAKLVFAVFSVTLLAACAKEPPVTTAVVQVEKPTIMVPNVDNIRMRDVEWHVITRNAKPGTDGHIDMAWKRASKDSLFAVTSKGYEDLSINIAEMTRVIRQLQAQVQAYKDYYQKDTAPKEDPNAKKK